MLRKLLVLSELYWPERGGAELATHLILGVLKAQYEVTVVTGTACPEQLYSVKYFYTKLLDTPDKVQLWKNISILTKTYWFVRLVKNSDIVYIPRCSYPVIPLAKRYHKKVIVHVHNYQLVTYCSLVLSGESKPDFIHEFQHSVRFEILENRSNKKALLSPLMSPLNELVRYWVLGADAIVCVSNRQREIIASAIPELKDKLKVISNPLPQVPLVEKRTREPQFLYLGGDSYIKGFFVLLKSSQRVAVRNSNVKFLLLGKYADASRIMTENLKTHQTLGYVKNQEVWKLYSKCNALLFPSLSEEPLPYAVVESMLSGTIPIASTVGGVPEIVRGTVAERMMFSPGDIEGSVDRMEELLSFSPESLASIGADLRDSVLLKFNLDMISAQLLEVFS